MLEEQLKLLLNDVLLSAVERRFRRQRFPATETTLIVQPDHLGDIVLSQPAVHLLRENKPDHRLVAIVGPWSAEIAARTWPVDDVVAFDFPLFNRQVCVTRWEALGSIPRAVDLFASFRPACALIMRPEDSWSSAATRAAGIDKIVTGDDPRTARFGSISARSSSHNQRSAKAISIAAAAIGDAILDPTWHEFPLRVVVDQFDANPSEQAGTRKEPIGTYVVIHPGSGVPVKEWTIHRWREIVRYLESQGLTVILTGGRADDNLCASIVLGTSARSVSGDTNLDQLCRILAGARVVIGPDCGPLHLAVALGVPTVHLFGPSDSIEFGPWGDPCRHRVVSAGWRCPHCRDLSPTRPAGCGCMLAISADDVILTIDTVLG